MITPVDFVADLANPQLGFLLRALVAAVLAAVVCGVVGCFVVLRGMAFIGDAVAHSVFPGLAIAFVMGGSLLAGGLIAGVGVALLIAVVSHRARVGHDSAIGIFYAAAFAVGLVVLSRTPAYSANVTGFLFGSITGVTVSDIVAVACTLLAVAVCGLLFGRALIAVCIDRDTAQAMGIPVLLVEAGLYVAIACTVVVSVRTVGNILVLALLVTPAATARLLCRRLGAMVVCAAAVGALSAVVGMYVAWALDAPAGATIVLVSTAFFVLALLPQGVRWRGTRGRGTRGRRKPHGARPDGARPDGTRPGGKVPGGEMSCGESRAAKTTDTTIAHSLDSVSPFTQHSHAAHRHNSRPADRHPLNVEVP